METERYHSGLEENKNRNRKELWLGRNIQNVKDKWRNFAKYLMYGSHILPRDSVILY